MSKSVLDILIEARKLIEKPEHWTQGQLIRDGFGRSLGDDVFSENAVAFCFGGAIMRVAGSRHHDAMEAFARAATRRKYAHWNDGVYFNNYNSHRRVLAAVDRAIKAKRADASP